MSSSTFLFIHHLRRLTVPIEVNTSPWTTLQMVQAFSLMMWTWITLSLHHREWRLYWFYFKLCSLLCFFSWWRRHTACPDTQSHVCFMTVNMSFVRVSSLWIWMSGVHYVLVSAGCCLDTWPTAWSTCISGAGLELASLSRCLRPSAYKDEMY